LLRHRARRRPVPENDSHGEFAFAAAELWRYSGDEKTARALWPHVPRPWLHGVAAGQRAQRREPEGRAHAYFGLMPPSISHEAIPTRRVFLLGRFLGLRRYRSAVELATGLGSQATLAPGRAARRVSRRPAGIACGQHRPLRPRRAARRRGPRRLRSDLEHGGAEPGGLLHALPRPLVRRTFDRYWRNFQARRKDEAAGVRHGDGAYTPYEWRNVGAFVRLGERERAQEAMAYFHADRRPQGWNQWAEVVVRDAREPRFLGDMPHGWVAPTRSARCSTSLPTRTRASRRWCWRPACRWPGCVRKGSRSAIFGRPGRLSWSARVGADGAIDVRVSGLRSFRAVA
jgi:hypothetical protein